MDPVLHISSWPSAIESISPRENPNVGWVSGVYDTYRDPILVNLIARVTDPINVFLFSDGEALATNLQYDITCCDLKSGSAGPILASMDLIILPQCAMMNWRELLSLWAIPPVILSDNGGSGELGLTVIPQMAEAAAAMSALLISDPPSRRKSLDLLRGSPCNRNIPIRCQVEGVFDSSYSLALVNRRLAIALDEDAKTEANLVTFEQGPNPKLQVAALAESEVALVESLWTKT
jgi:hypothetical protein